ncbi:MAG: hypothetical protein HeimC2_30270 [Candidatus Heimdallarchaeota archaeon LC_2]|nr:MAG: hypothetical protein HeimC2_30270 [Candidatus Heimdallarchaeota archaeon LC_2]
MNKLVAFVFQILAVFLLFYQCEKKVQILPDLPIIIVDNAFLLELLDLGVDTDGDSLINYAEAEVVNNLDLSGQWRDSGEVRVDSWWIENMTGIEAFVNLDTLKCAWNDLRELIPKDF